MTLSASLSPPRHPHAKCFSTLGSPEMTWEQTLDFAQTHQFQGVEIRCLAGSVVAPANFAQLLPSPDQFKAELAERNLAFQMFGTSAKLLQRTANELENLLHFARFADATGCPWLRIFDGGNAQEPLSAAVIAETTEFLTNWEALRQEHGIKCQLAVETHDAFASLAQTQSAISQLPHFAILWDTHHTWRFGESLSAYYDAVKDRTVHYHLKDSVNRPSKRKPFTYVEPGAGEFPWAQLQQALGDCPPQGFLSLEWERHWNPELSPIADVVASYHRMTAGW